MHKTTGRTPITQFAVFLATIWVGNRLAHAQSADWTDSVWHDPQVRYLLADLALGGTVETYRKYATEEKDPDSRETVRLYDAGVRVVNVADFERKILPHPAGKNGQIQRIVFRGSKHTISGNEVQLSHDGSFSQPAMRLVLLDLSLGAQTKDYERKGKSDPSVGEALRRFAAGARVTNGGQFAVSGAGAKRRLVFAKSGLPADGGRVVLNLDFPYFESNTRYFLADMLLGGAREFYARTAEVAHEKSCEEAVARLDHGVTVSNLALFERKKVDGKTLITRKNSNIRIGGADIKLSTD